MGFYFAPFLLEVIHTLLVGIRDTHFAGKAPQFPYLTLVNFDMSLGRFWNNGFETDSFLQDEAAIGSMGSDFVWKKTTTKNVGRCTSGPMDPMGNIKSLQKNCSCYFFPGWSVLVFHVSYVSCTIFTLSLRPWLGVFINDPRNPIVNDGMECCFFEVALRATSRERLRLQKTLACKTWSSMFPPFRKDLVVFWSVFYKVGPKTTFKRGMLA